MKNQVFDEIDKKCKEFEEYCGFIRRNVLGHSTKLKTPFGERSIIYLDWTASGRSLRFIEESLMKDVMPYYGNTHSIASNNARQSTWFIYEAREAVRQFVGGNPEDAIIFTGYGSSGGVTKFLRIMEASNWISVLKRFESTNSLKNPNQTPINVLPESISVNVLQDRWKSYKCIKCETQYNTEAAFRRHFNKLHREENVINDELKKNGDVLHSDITLLFNIVFLIDPSSHHSLFLPFVEYVKRNSSYSKFGHNYLLKFDLEFLRLNDKGEIDHNYLSERVRQIVKDNDQPGTFKSRNSIEIENTIPFALISAGSNVTGRLNNYNKISAIVHEYNGFSVVDFAATAPHSRPHMSPPLNIKGSVDVGVFSPHKFIGGPSTPGVLVIKRDLLLSDSPSDPGGNSVFFVSLDKHEYLLNKEEREESGTVDILGISRLGMLMKFELGLPQHIKELKERKLFEEVVGEIEKYNASAESSGKIKVLGYEEVLLNRENNAREDTHLEKYKDLEIKCNRKISGDLGTLPIISFLIKPFNCVGDNLVLKFISKEFPITVKLDLNETIIGGYYLHYNFVCSLLNDLFGIQTRGGCSCAGPYSQRLLGYDDNAVRELYRDLVIRGIESIRPGFSRISLHWSCDQEIIEYLTKAIKWIADHGWKFLPLYLFEESLGTWRHKSEWKSLEKIHRRWLADSMINYGIDGYVNKEDFGSKKDTDLTNEISPEQVFQIANEILRNIEHIILNNHKSENCGVSGSYRGEETFSLNCDISDVIYMNNQHFTASINNANLYNLSEFEQLSESSLLWFVTPKCVQNIIFSIRNRDEDGNETKDAFNYLNGKRDNIGESSDQIQNEANDSMIKTKQSVNSSLKGHKKERLNKLLPNPVELGNIRKYVGMAIRKFDMIRDGDNLLVAVSGGKDSLTMLHTLLFLQKVAPVKFNISVATIDPQTSEMDASKLVPYMEMIGVKYHFISYPIVEIASKVKQKQKKMSYCAFCARMKRGLLYSCMKENGYNVLALGQHLDDICESFLMSLLNNGKLNTMKANYYVSEHNVRVVRPMIYCRERDLANFAIKSGLPVIAENCPACFSQPKERRHIKQLLSQEESHNPTIYSSILNAILPLISINHTNSKMSPGGAPVRNRNSQYEYSNGKLVPILDEDISTEIALTSFCQRK